MSKLTPTDYIKVIVLSLVPGCIAFAALFLWSAPAALRIFLGASVIMLTIGAPIVRMADDEDRYGAFVSFAASILNVNAGRNEDGMNAIGRIREHQHSSTYSRSELALDRGLIVAAVWIVGGWLIAMGWRHLAI